MKPTEIYKAYKQHYDGEVQGCCPVIAEQIIEHNGGVPVAGYLKFGGCQRPHWWVEIDGQTVDPMGDDLMSHEDYYEREEVHRDTGAFQSAIDHAAQWRVAI